MGSFWKDRFADIRGNLLWQVIVWICGGGVMTALISSVQFLRHHQPTWQLIIMVFVISTLGLAVVFLLTSRRSRSIQESTAWTSTAQTAVTVSSLVGKPAQAPPFDVGLFFRTAHHSPITAEVEQNMRLIAKNNSPRDEVGFLCRFIGVGLVAYVYDMAWAYIYKSQLLMLEELNRRVTMPVSDAKKYYDRATTEYPSVYPKYQFNSWLGFVIQHQLMIRHPSEMLEITHKGKDFLKYLAHWGANPSMRKF